MRILRFVLLIVCTLCGIRLSAQQVPAEYRNTLQALAPADQVETMDSIAVSFRRTDKSKAAFLLRVSIRLAQESALDSLQFAQRISLSRFYRSDGYYDSALLQIDTAKTIALKLQNDRMYAEALAHQGMAQTRMGVYGAASATYLEGLQVAERLRDTNLIGRMHQQWGLMYFYTKDFATAAEYTKKALQLFVAIKDTLSIAANLDNLGLYYSNLEMFDSAYKYQLAALPLFESEGDSAQLLVFYNNLGSTLARTGQYDEAEKYLEFALGMAERQHDEYRIMTVLATLAQLYELKYDEKNIQEFAFRAYELSMQIDNKFYAQSSALALAGSYYRQKNFERAAYYYKLSDSLRELIFDDEIAKAADEAAKKYQASERLKQIEILEAERETAEAKSERDNLIKWAAFIFAMILLAFSVVLIRRYKEKQKDNRLLHEKNEAIEHQKAVIEEKNHEITDSINYATRIQTAVLPSKEKISSLFPANFIYYRPRDIISGDFYWTAEGRNGVRFVAVADCTGHGVPGAMMSMLGTSILNRLIARKSSTGPGKVLDALHEELLVTLNEKKGTRQVSDGMDIALLMFDPIARKITIASADRPVYYTIGNALHVLQPDKASIGTSLQKDTPYHETVLDVGAGLSVYLFSDGITDQFGGPEKKKFMSKRLKDVITSNAERGLSEREVIFTKVFDEWKNGMEQTDDMTLINIEIT